MTNLVGVLDWDIRVAMAEVSRGGCVVETSVPVKSGTVARLIIEIDGTDYMEDVRVTRCVTVAGAGERHRLAMEFLTLRRPGPQSLRLYAAALPHIARLAGPVPG